MINERELKLQKLLKETAAKRYEKMLARLSKSTNYAFLNLAPFVEGEVFSDKETPLTKLQENEVKLCRFEAGLSEFLELTDDEVREVKRLWFRCFALEWFENYEVFNLSWQDDEARAELRLQAANRAMQATGKVSDDAINELREIVYREKYWLHTEQAYYRYVTYFIGLLSAFFKSEKPRSSIAKKIDFERLFSANTLTELREALTVILTRK